MKFIPASIAVCLSGILGPASLKAPDLAVPNGDFEAVTDDTLENWGWWSREGGGSATPAPGEGRDGSACVLIEHDQERDWAFMNDLRFAVEPGQEYTVTGWVRGPNTQFIEIAVVAQAGGELLSWSIGGDAVAGPTPEWTELKGGARIPDGCDEIYVRFVGRATTSAYIDDVSLSAGLPVREPKPPIEGWAKKRVTEKLDRAFVAVPAGEGKVYLGWRILADDPDDVAFNLYRRDDSPKATKLNSEPITETSDWLDETVEDGQEYSYELRVIQGRSRQKPVGRTTCAADSEAGAYVSIPLVGDHTFQKVGVGDLDGDGRLDYVLKQPNSNVDPYVNYWKKSPGTFTLEAYTGAGDPLWQYDLGWAIEQGIWYSPYIVADLDGDGKAEVAVKTGEGDPRDEDGRVHEGPEWVTILNGETGEEITKAPWPSRDRFPDYNVWCRNQMLVAYLDGKTPFLIVERGTYSVMKCSAYTLENGKLVEAWSWEEREEFANYRGQGAHISIAADVDQDGRDEICLGSSVIDDNGVGLWSTGLGHPDHMYVGEIDPDHPGLEMYNGMETRQPIGNGMVLLDAATGEIIWSLDEPTLHVHHSGMCADIDAAHRGLECYGGERDDEEQRWMFSAKGELIAQDDMSLAPRSAFWDADPQREVVRGSHIFDYGGVSFDTRPEGRYIMTVDLLGDWREEIITTLDGEMRIYTTTIPAVDRRPCLLQDPIYRSYVTSAAMGYYQVPMLSTYFGN